MPHTIFSIHRMWLHWLKPNRLADCVLVATLLKGLRMVVRALWRSEARRVVPWSETLHGHSRYQSHSQSTQSTHLSHCLRQQWRHNPIQHRDVTIATQGTLLWAHVNGTEINVKSTDRRSNIYLFLYVQGLIQDLLSLRNLDCILHLSISYYDERRLDNTYFLYVEAGNKSLII